MESKDIINSLLQHLGVKAPSFANEIGVRYSRVQDIQLGRTKKISLDLANKICAAYPEINKAYLLKGEGEMLNNGGRNINVNHSPNANVAGNDIYINKDKEQSVIKTIIDDDSISKADLFAVVRHLQHTNDRHLATIEKLTSANERLNAVIIELLTQYADVLPNMEIRKIIKEIGNRV
jgi:DNA-binding Xre family transcriptional regulator